MIHVGLGFVLAKLHSLKGESSIYQFIASASMGVMKSSNRNSRSGVAVTKNRCFTLCPTIMHRLAATSGFPAIMIRRNMRVGIV